MLECSDGSLYTGITTDIARRLAEHRECGRRAAKFFRTRTPVRICYTETHPNRAAASRREWQIKQLSPAAKRALIVCTDKIANDTAPTAQIADPAPPVRQ
ncbi:MAG: GIY-YIG nuclease family protein [Cellvibrionales bacterium]|nr:GIY-YIG nuclease family protein [Cellvibrionales bacterium]